MKLGAYSVAYEQARADQAEMAMRFETLRLRKERLESLLQTLGLLRDTELDRPDHVHEKKSDH